MTVLTKQSRIAQLASNDPALVFTSIHHFIDLDWLHEAYRRTRKDGAPGIDGETGREYARDLDRRLADLLQRVKSGRYFAPPVRRTEIPKGNGPEKRGLGIPTFEDKILQRAVAMLLEPIYEPAFLNCSFGFRPRRSAHDALHRMWESIMSLDGCWILDVDIRQYFDRLDHQCLRNILDKRVRDGVIRRLIDKWLKAKVWKSEDEQWTPESGVPQGGVISPLLSNIYLHEVLDTWFTDTAQPCMRGRVFLIRFADDFVIGCEYRDDAQRLMNVLPKRFGKYGLTLHPDKTRMVRFTCPGPKDDDPDGPGTFDLLGFTHYWKRGRNGHWTVARKTRKKSFNRAVTTLYEWMARHRHLPVRVQHRKLTQKLRGHYGYYGITGNYRALSRLQHCVESIWRKQLNRRTRKPMSWKRFKRLLAAYPLPKPRIVQGAAKLRKRAEVLFRPLPLFPELAANPYV